MADFSQGPPPPPPMMHTGRIPSFKNNHGENFQNRCANEPPACVQNAMMTKDKKPFTYTPGGLDLSQIRTPSMARRLNKQQQQIEDQSNPAYYQRPNPNGGAPPPPPPPPGPPPPPALVINVANPPKAPADGERPEIVIPENPIGMLRKTHSPYHWESEMNDRLREGPVPKFVQKSATPSPVAPQMRAQPPRQFSQRPPDTTPPSQLPQQQNSPSSPVCKPEPKYPSPPQPYSNSPQPQYSNSPQQQYSNSPQPQYSNSPQQQYSSTPQYANSPAPPFSNSQGSSPQVFYQSPVQTPNKDMLQRQDSQFNHSPSPWPKDTVSTSSSKQTMSPSLDSSMKSPSPAGPWRQDNRASPYQNVNSPVQVEIPVQVSQQQTSPGSFRDQNTSPYNNVNRQVQSPEVQRNAESATPWRQVKQQPTAQQRSPPPPAQQQYVQQPTQYQQNAEPDEVRYQTHMTIPVTPRKNPQTNQEVFSPKADAPQNPPWVNAANTLNKSTPPWCQKGENKGLSREPSVTSPAQPPWCQRPPENQTPQPDVSRMGPQPPWIDDRPDLPPGRVIPIQIEAREIPVNAPPAKVNPNLRINPQSVQPNKLAQPQLRIIIGMNQQGNPQQQAPIVQMPQSPPQQQPQQQIRRVNQPQIVRMDGPMSPPPAQPKTRIIPIQMEPSSPDVSSPRIVYHPITINGAPRQSKSFRVLQVITGTEESDSVEEMENQHGFTDL